MNVNYLNAVINSFNVIAETVARLTPEKGTVMKKDELETDLPYIMLYTLGGSLEGNIAIAMDEETILELVSHMINGDEKIKEMDMEVLGKASEFLGLIKTNMINRFKDMGVELGIKRADFIMKDELPTDQEDYLEVIAETHIGDFEISMKIKESHS